MYGHRTWRLNQTPRRLGPLESIPVNGRPSTSRNAHFTPAKRSAESCRTRGAMRRPSVDAGPVTTPPPHLRHGRPGAAGSPLGFGEWSQVTSRTERRMPLDWPDRWIIGYPFGHSTPRGTHLEASARYHDHFGSPTSGDQAIGRAGRRIRRRGQPRLAVPKFRNTLLARIFAANPMNQKSRVFLTRLTPDFARTHSKRATYAVGSTRPEPGAALPPRPTRGGCRHTMSRWRSAVQPGVRPPST